MTNKEKLAELLDARERLTINLIVGEIKKEKNIEKIYLKLMKNYKAIEKLLKND